MSLVRHCDICGRAKDPATGDSLDTNELRVLTIPTVGGGRQDIPLTLEVAMTGVEDICFECTRGLTRRALTEETRRRREMKTAPEKEKREETSEESPPKPDLEIENEEVVSKPVDVSGKFQASQAAAEARRRRVQK